MRTPGSPEWRAHVAKVEAAEDQQPVRWWYLSFADEDGWLGGCIVEARGMTGAVRRAHLLGINPGGEVAMWALPPGIEKTLPQYKLLSKEELGDDPERIITGVPE